MPGTPQDVLAHLPPDLAAALAGEEAVHVVGGAVRDAALGRAVGDVDLVVEGDARAVAVRVAVRLGGDVVAHERFGTATVRAPIGNFDFAAARRETYARPGALPDVELGASLAEDLRRRDVTVNAIAVRVADGRLTAHPGALEDLRARALRVLHDRSFADDPTRLLRVARYAARLGFAPEPHTDGLAADAVADGALETVTGGRLGAELALLVCEPQPAAVLSLARWGLGPRLLGPAFAPQEERLAVAVELTPDDGDPGLAALAAALAGADADGLDARLRALAVRAQGRDVVVRAASAAPALAAVLGADPEPSALWQRLRREPPEGVAVAGALDPAARAPARRWLAELRHVRAAITGEDLLGAGLRGEDVGRALDAALRARLDGAAPDRDAQLAVALRAAG